MQVKVFMQSAGNFVESDLLHAMGEGIEQVFAEINSVDDAQAVSVDRKRGASSAYTVNYVWDEAYTPCDLAVIYGSWKPREKAHHIIRTSVATTALRFLVIETALLDRRTDRENVYWRVGVNGYLGRDARWPVLPEDAAESRLAQFGIDEWSDWKNKDNGHILLGLQIPGDASLRGTDIYAWAQHTITEIRKVTDRKILIRPHPLTSDKGLEDLYRFAGRITFDGVKNISYSTGNTLQQDLKGAYCTVVFSSGMSIDSVVSGVPVVCGDSSNFAWPVCTRNLNLIEDLVLPDAKKISAWLRHLAACQWSKKEMSSGECFTALAPIIESI